MDSPASSAPRRPCFAEDDHGLASIAGAGELSDNRLPFLSRTGRYRAAAPWRRGGNVFSTSAAHCSSSPPYFLEACFLCKKPLGCNRDIFMYRGDVAFCSEECRKEEIEADEGRERSVKLSAASMKATKRSKIKTDSTSSSSPDKSHAPFCAVAAA